MTEDLTHISVDDVENNILSIRGERVIWTRPSPSFTVWPPNDSISRYDETLSASRPISCLSSRKKNMKL